MKEMNDFKVILLGIIYDPRKKKILIGKRRKDKYIPGLTWAFPGGKPNNKEDIEKTLKKKIKLKTGLNIANLGNVFTKTYPEDRNLLALYFLCEVVDGKEKAADDMAELKWVKPEEIEKHFTTSFHPHLKEYILNLK